MIYSIISIKYFLPKHKNYLPWFISILSSFYLVFWKNTFVSDWMRRMHSWVEAQVPINPSQVQTFNNVKSIIQVWITIEVVFSFRYIYALNQNKQCSMVDVTVRIQHHRSSLSCLILSVFCREKPFNILYPQWNRMHTEEVQWAGEREGERKR